MASSTMASSTKKIKPVHVMWGKNSIISERCVWVTDGYRKVCMTYKYIPHTGYLCYAACIYRSKTKEWTTYNMGECESTTTRRFDLRPVKTFVNKYIDYCSLISTIRHLMCHKFGCKGVRVSKKSITTSLVDYNYSSSSSSSISSSSNEYLSESEESIQDSIEGYMNTLDMSIYNKILVDDIQKNKTHLPTFYSKYFHSDNYEKYEKYGYHRLIYIAFKGDPITGDLLYAGCINHDFEPYTDFTQEKAKVDDSNHYNTAHKRLEIKPIYLNIPTEFRYQLYEDTSHHEDITHIIVSNIFDRKKGRLQIKQH